MQSLPQNNGGGVTVEKESYEQLVNRLTEKSDMLILIGKEKNKSSLNLTLIGRAEEFATAFLCVFQKYPTFAELVHLALEAKNEKCCH